MIADDDAGIVDFLSILLEYEGYEVSSSLNGATLLTLENNFPHLILLDIWMSGIDGRDICKHLKQKEATKSIPVIMISASNDIERSALDAGADDFLSKPFDVNDLLKKIEKFLN